MPITWRLNGNRIDIAFSDPYTLAESERVMREVFADPRAKRPLRFLVDVRQGAGAASGAGCNGRSGAHGAAVGEHRRVARVAIHRPRLSRVGPGRRGELARQPAFLGRVPRGPPRNENPPALGP